MGMLLNIANALFDIKDIGKEILARLPEKRVDPNTRPEKDVQRERLVRYLHNSMVGRAGAGVRLKDFKAGCRTARIDMTGMRETIRAEGFEIVTGGDGQDWIVRKGA